MNHLEAKTICQKIMDQESRLSNTINQFWDITKYSYFPNLLVDTDVMRTEKSKNMSAHKYHLNSKRNIVFSFGLSVENEKKITPNRVELYYDLIKTRDEYYGKLNLIIEELKSLVSPACLKYRRNTGKKRLTCISWESEDDVLSKCEKREKEIAPDQTQLFSINKKLEDFFDVEQYIESNKAKDLFNEHQHDFSLNWEFREVTHILDLQNLLTANDIGNIIIVNHGNRSNGSIIDSFGNDIRVKTFLKNFSESLDSISFFSCFSHLIPVTYHLAEKFKNVANPPKIIFVKEQEFLGKSGFTILKTLAHFIKDVEKEIVSNSVRNIVPSFEEKNCSIEFPSLEVKSGEVEVSLNRNFISVLSSRSDSKIPFPCKFINDKKNMIYLTSISKKQAIVDNTPNQNVIVSFDDGAGVEYIETFSSIIDHKLFNLKFNF